jgi:hypothetical protein
MASPILLQQGTTVIAVQEIENGEHDVALLKAVVCRAWHESLKLTSKRHW